MGKDNNKDNERKPKFCKHASALKDVIKDSDNDFTWYNKNPQLVKDSANLPYSNMLGVPVNLVNSGSKRVQSLPGLAIIDLFPTLGTASTRNDAINTAAQAVFAYIRSFNSGSRNYYATDYFMYLMSVTQLYALYSDLVRAYGLCRTYSLTNRFYGKFLLESLGYNYEDISSNLADFRMVINQFAIKINQYAIPKEFNYIDRLAWLPLNVYTDANHDKAQLYAFKFTHLYKWNSMNVKSGSALEPILIPTNKTVADIKNLINNFLDAIRLNEDIGIMSGDTYKAFKSNIRTVNMIPEDVVTKPIFNEGVLAQIHNLKIAGTVEALSAQNLAGEGFDVAEGLEPSDALLAGWITQIEEVIYCEPFVVTNAALTNYTINATAAESLKDVNLILDCGYNDPTPEFNMEASRLVTVLGGRTTIDLLERDTLCEVYTCGTEIVEAVHYYCYDGEDNRLEEIAMDSKYMYDYNNDDDEVQFNNILRVKGYYDWAPHLYYVRQDPSTFVFNYGLPYGEIFNYGIMSADNFKGMHEVAIMSLFNLSNLLISTRMAKN